MKKEENKFHKVKVNNNELIVSKYSNLSENAGTIDNEEIKIQFIKCIIKIIKVGFPTTIFFLSLYIQQSICLSFIGKKYNNQDMINAIGVVNLYIDCTLVSLVIGLISGLDTLLSNALGTHNYYLFGLYVHRGRIVTYIIYLLFCIFHFIFGLKIISMFNIDKQTLEYCRYYLYPSIIYVAFVIQFSINYRILSIFEKSNISLLILSITTVLHPLWCYISINVLNYELLGAGLSMLISQFLSMILITLYMHYYCPKKEINFCINKDCFKGLFDYLKFTLPSTFIIIADSMAYEIQAIFAVFTSKQDYAIHIFISNIANLLFTLTHGFGVAATILIAENITKGLIRESKQVALYSFILAETIMSIIVIILILFRNSVLSLFMDDVNLLSRGSNVVVILAIAEIFDMTQGVMASIYKGLGKQKQASIITFVQFYLIQTIFSYLLAIKINLGVTGIWLSILMGNLVTTILYIINLFRFNFEQINKETNERLEKDQKLISNTIIEVENLN